MRNLLLEYLLLKLADYLPTEYDKENISVSLYAYLYFPIINESREFGEETISSN